MLALNEKYDFPWRFWSVNIWTELEKISACLATWSHNYTFTYLPALWRSYRFSFSETSTARYPEVPGKLLKEGSIVDKFNGLLSKTFVKYFSPSVDPAYRDIYWRLESSGRLPNEGELDLYCGPFKFNGQLPQIRKDWVKLSSEFAQDFVHGLPQSAALKTPSDSTHPWWMLLRVHILTVTSGQGPRKAKVIGYLLNLVNQPLSCITFFSLRWMPLVIKLPWTPFTQWQ